MTLKELQEKMRNDPACKAIIDPQDLHDGLRLVAIEGLINRINEALGQSKPPPKNAV